MRPHMQFRSWLGVCGVLVSLLLSSTPQKTCQPHEDGVRTETCQRNFNIDFNLLLCAFVGILININ